MHMVSCDVITLSGVSHWCQITGKIQEISFETLDPEYPKKYHIPDFENCKKPYTPKNLADPKINKLNIHGMCWSNLGPTSFLGPSRGREKALVRLAFKTTNCGF